MREQLALLIELQKAELAEGRLLAKKKELPDRMNSIEAEYKAHCAVVDADHGRLEGFEKAKAGKGRASCRGDRRP